MTEHHVPEEWVIGADNTTKEKEQICVLGVDLASVCNERHATVEHIAAIPHCWPYT